jgi:hypothetical protein
MATFNIVLDRRRKLKDGLYNLVVRVNMANDMIYLNISKLTPEQYVHVFIKKSGDEESITFREMCEEYKTKCERIYNKSNKERGILNLYLKGIEEKLQLSAPLRINTARDCYATCLDRAGVATKKISNMMVHSSVVVTEEYLASMNYKELFDLNSILF